MVVMVKVATKVFAADTPTCLLSRKEYELIHTLHSHAIPITVIICPFLVVTY